MAILDSQTATGFSWVQESVALFKQQTGKWISISAAYLLFMLLSSTISEVMAIVSILLWPAVTAYVLLIYRSVEMGKQESTQQIFNQLKPTLKPLLFLGLLAIIYLALAGWWLNDDMQAVVEMTKTQQSMSEAERMALVKTAFPLYAKLLLLLVPLFVVTWFSPLLIAVNQYPLVKAIKSSIAGVLQYFGALNIAWLVLTAYLMLFSIFAGLIVGVLGLVGTLAALVLFAVLLLGTTLFFAFQFVSYRDVFSAAPVVQTHSS